MKSKRIPLAGSVVVLAILACNLPAGQATPTPTAEVDLAATVTAQALTLEAPTATAAPPTETPTITPTGTPTVPQVTVSSATNCRTGPSTVFDLLYTQQPGQTSEVIGKNTPTGYWIIKYPGGTCWLWGQYATVSGDTSGLTEYALPFTPTPSLPAAPTHFDVGLHLHTVGAADNREQRTCGSDLDGRGQQRRWLLYLSGRHTAGHAGAECHQLLR